MANTSLPLESIRGEFPLLSQKINNRSIVYFDNGATTQKPQRVIDTLVEYYQNHNANVHRGAHQLARISTEIMEKTRQHVQKFLHAQDESEIIFTSGTTASINLVASNYGKQNIQLGDEVIITEMEHHSNFVPWQQLCEETGALLRVVPVLDNGELDLDSFEQFLSSKTKLVAITHLSNTLGTINPIERIIEQSHQHGAVVLVDAAQSAARLPIDVQALDCDFLALSAHKMYGPTGLGILYGKKGILEAIPPYQVGGGMVQKVTLEKTTYQPIPHKFEAGTPNIAAIAAFDKALDLLESIGLENITEHEKNLTDYLDQALSSLPGIKIYGTSPQKLAIVSFRLEGQHPLDTSLLLDSMGILVRSGHHCTQPLMQHFGIEGTVRASLGVYNTSEEVEQLIEGLKKIV